MNNKKVTVCVCGGGGGGGGLKAARPPKSPGQIGLKTFCVTLIAKVFPGTRKMERSTSEEIVSKPC